MQRVDVCESKESALSVCNVSKPRYRNQVTAVRFYALGPEQCMNNRLLIHVCKIHLSLLYSIHLSMHFPAVFLVCVCKGVSVLAGFALSLCCWCMLKCYSRDQCQSGDFLSKNDCHCS